jgi:hypothetical protein
MHLGLVRSATGENIQAPEVAESLRVVSAYQQRFDEYHRIGLSQLVGTPVRCGDDIRLSDSFIDEMSNARHFQLIGASGCGKSLLAKRMALTANQSGRVVIFASAQQYQGKLSTLLDRSVAHLHPDTSNVLPTAATRIGILTLVKDGCECSVHRRDALQRTCSCSTRFRGSQVIPRERQLTNAFGTSVPVPSLKLNTRLLFSAHKQDRFPTN